MSDIEPTVIDLEPQAAPVIEPSPVAENAEPPTEEGEGTQPEDKPADKTFTQAELDEIVQKRISKLERKALKERTELETRLKVQQETQVKPVVMDDEPNVEDFTDYTDYLKALAKHTVKQERLLQAREEEDGKRKQANSTRVERLGELQHRVIDNGERKYDDFEDVVKSDKVDYSEAAIYSILESDISHEIFYHLAKHQDEAKRIADLPAYAQAKEIGKLEDRLLAKTPVKASNAPKPIEPIGSNSGSSKSLEEMSPAEYIEARRKQKPKWA
jgi:hypothetical protein